MFKKSTGSNSIPLDDGARIAVIGAGPTGSFFSFFALNIARMIGKEISIDIYDPKDFTRCGPKGCNHCGGVISELLVQTLAVEGLNLPNTIVQRGINSYQLHTFKSSVKIETPALENTIATVSRGGGPLGLTNGGIESFDRYLLQKAIDAGAVHHAMKVDRISNQNGRPVLFSGESDLQDADLVVGATGINGRASALYEDMGFGYEQPATVKTAIAEIILDEKIIQSSFGNSIHLFLLPIKNLKFAAMIPKGKYITLCILGKELNAASIKQFLEQDTVQKVLPSSLNYKVSCQCLPKMNVSAPGIPFDDRVVVCGDSGSTRLFKDGIGAAYLTGKAAAKTALFHGVSKQDFRKYYYPVYRELIIDNWFGRYLFMITDLYKKYGLLTKGMLEVVEKEQHTPGKRKILSSILWNMFTGNERYKNIFYTALSTRMHLDLWKEFASCVFNGGNHDRGQTREDISGW